MCNNERGWMRGQLCKKTIFQYSIIPLFYYSIFKLRLQNHSLQPCFRVLTYSFTKTTCDLKPETCYIPSFQYSSIPILFNLHQFPTLTVALSPPRTLRPFAQSLPLYVSPSPIRPITHHSQIPASKQELPLAI